MTAATFFVGAWGYLQLLKLPAASGQANALPAGGGSLLSDSNAVLALAALVATGVIAGVLIVVRRISPLASGLPGLVFLAWTALYLVSVRRAVQYIPLRSHPFGAGWEWLLFHGILGAVGAVMVVPLFTPSRWRGARRDLGRRAEAEGLARDVDDYLTKAATNAGAQRGRQGTLKKDEAAKAEGELVGTVLPRRVAGATIQVDTSRVTGASRALRNTGSFNLPTGAHHRPAGTDRPVDADHAGTDTGTSDWRFGD